MMENVANAVSRALDSLPVFSKIKSERVSLAVLAASFGCLLLTCSVIPCAMIVVGISYMGECKRHCRESHTTLARGVRRRLPSCARFSLLASLYVIYCKQTTTTKEEAQQYRNL